MRPSRRRSGPSPSRLPGLRGGLRIGALIVLGTALTVLTRTGDQPDRATAPAQALRGFLAGDREEPLYAPGRLLVQITTRAQASASVDVPVDKAASAPRIATGLGAVDALARGAGVVAVSRPFAAAGGGAKAAAAGVDRWLMFEFDAAAAGLPALDLPALADEFAALPEVQAVTLDWRAWPADLPADPGLAANWGHENRVQFPAFDWTTTYAHTGAAVGAAGFDADVPEAWQLPQGYGSADVVIAIIDSGVDLDHPDLRLVEGYDFGEGDDVPDDDSDLAGHGTCCAGVAAALNDGVGAVGVAPGCSIMPLKVAGRTGAMYFSSIQQALYYAADKGADVVSMSFGAPIDTDPAMEAALKYAHDAGVVMVASAGNANQDVISYPAASPYVIAVGAASPGGERKRSSDKSAELNTGVAADPRGCTCDDERWWGSNYGVAQQDAGGAIDLLGPTMLPTCDIAGAGGYQPGDLEPWFNGTSCAAPYVAGVAALVLSADPALTPDQVRAALVAGASDVVGAESGAGWDRYAGYGLVNATAAILDAGPGVVAAVPSAAFSAAPVSGPVGLQVRFSDASSGTPLSWFWDFGDGGTSRERNPVHVYTAAGVYDVTLTVANAGGGDTSLQTGLVTVTAGGGALGQNHPNPFNPVTRVAFTLPRSGPARLDVFDTRGRLVVRLADGDLAAGDHVVTWDATGQPSGLYFYRLQAAGVDETRKMTLLK